MFVQEPIVILENFCKLNTVHREYTITNIKENNKDNKFHNASFPHEIEIQQNRIYISY